MPDCPLCQTPAGRYDWANVCCRVRFMAVLPSKSARMAWLDRWRMHGEGDMVARVVKALRGLRAPG